MEALKVEEVRHLFLLPGSCNLEIVDALYGEGDIAAITARHEQAVAHMADAYARVLRRPGVCLLHNGPGLTNAVTGVAEAFLAHSPLVVISGAPMTRQLLKDSIQEIDQISLLKPIVKWNGQVNRAERIPELFRHAFRVANSGKRGPVHIDIPRDLLQEEVDVTFWPRASYHSFEGHSPDGVIREAANALLAAKRPLAICGGGVVWSDATEEAVQLGEMITMPLATSYGHLDAVPADHPLAVGQLGRDGSGAARKLAQDADVILALGTRLAHFTSFYSEEYIPRGSGIIQVEIDPKEIGRNFPVQLGIVGDAKEVTRKLIEAVKELGGGFPRNKERLKEILSIKDGWLSERAAEADPSRTPIKPQAVYPEVRKALNRDAIVTLDDGSCCGFAYHLMDFYRPRTFISPLDLACIGFGYPAALGAKVAEPGRQVVSINGDGGFIMNVQELATAVQHGLNVTAIVMNNNSWGSEKAYQKYYFNEHYLGVDLVNPDFVKLAESFGARGFRVERASEVGDAVKDALNCGRPSLVEVPVDPDEFAPPVRTDVLRMKG